MSSINPSLTGSGKASIAGGAGLTILEIAPKMTVAGGRVDFDGNEPGIERIHHAGWVGVGADLGGSGPHLVTWSMFLRYPYEDFRMPANIFGDAYFWDLTPGTTVELEIDW